MNAVATAGGFTYRANRGPGLSSSIRVRRGKNLNACVPDLQLRPGDTVRIGERYL